MNRNQRCRIYRLATTRGLSGTFCENFLRKRGKTFLRVLEAALPSIRYKMYTSFSKSLVSGLYPTTMSSNIGEMECFSSVKGAGVQTSGLKLFRSRGLTIEIPVKSDFGGRHLRVKCAIEERSYTPTSLHRRCQSSAE